MLNSKMRRSMAWLMAAAMVATSVPVSAAEDTTEVAAETAVEQEAAPAEVPAETAAPEVVAPETEAPETTAPETTAPETSAPETAAPAETEGNAPETEAPSETEAPTEAPSEQPVVDIVETEAPTEAPTESPAETEAPAETETQAPETENQGETETREYSYVYTGQEITVETEEGETVTGGTASAVNVGEYTVEVTTVDGKTASILWEIEPAELTVTCYYQEVSSVDVVEIDGESSTAEKAASETAPTIRTEMEVTGFVNGEDETTAAGYVAPQYKEPATIEEAKEMKAFGGEADNYTFVYADSVEVKSDIATYESRASYVRIRYTTEDGSSYYTGRIRSTDSDVLEKIKGGTVTVSHVTGGEKWEAIKADLNQNVYNGTLEKFTLVQIDIQDADGNPVSLTDEEKSKLSVTLSMSGEAKYFIGNKFSYYQWVNGKAEALPADSVSDVVMNLTLATFDIAGNSLDYVVVSDLGVAKECPLEVGTYSITANLTVWAEDNAVLGNTKVYMTSKAFPPLDPVTNNAKLVVGQDENGKKTMTLTVENLSEIFMLQSLEGGDGVTIKETDVVTFPEGTFRYPSRIDKIVMELANAKGIYALGKSKQSPALFEQDYEMPMHLEVDFDSAVRSFDEAGEGEYSFKHVFEDEATGVSVSVKTTDETLGKKLENGSLQVTDIHDTYDAQIQADHVANVNFKAYDVELLDESREKVSLEGTANTEVIVTMTSDYDSPRLLPLKNGKFEWVKVNTNGNKISYGNTLLKELGVIALVDDNDVSNWITSTAVDRDFSAVYAMPRRALWKGDAVEKARDDSYIGQSADYSNTSTYKAMARREETENEVKYYFGFGESESARYEYSWSHPDDTSKLSVNLPYKEDYSYYLVTNNGTTETMTPLTSGAISGNQISFDLIQRGDDETVANQVLMPLWRGYMGIEPNLEERTAYVLMTKKTTRYATMPVPAWVDYDSIGGGYSNPYYYNGKERTGYVNGANCTISGTNQTKDAGTYTITVTPDEGYTWPDGTTEAKELTWTIEKIRLQVYVESEVINLGGTPKMEIKYSGWGEGDDEDTALNFDKNAFHASVPEDFDLNSEENLEKTVKFILTMDEGTNENCNYDVQVKPYGELTLTAKKILDVEETMQAIAEASGGKVYQTLFGKRFVTITDGDSAELVMPEGVIGTGIKRDLPASSSKTTVILKTDEDHIWSDASSSIWPDWYSIKIIDKPAFKTRLVYETETETVSEETELTPAEAGTYTVSANIWFKKEDSGLPMNPHITSDIFPPKDPVINNATLTVDEDLHATVEIPILIKNRIMNIKEIEGLNIVDSTRNDDGYLTSITVDLGTIEYLNEVIDQSCEISLDMGDLAMTISGFDKEQQWPATFQVNGFEKTGVETAAARGVDSEIDDSSIGDAMSMAFGTSAESESESE